MSARLHDYYSSVLPRKFCFSDFITPMTLWLALAIGPRRVVVWSPGRHSMRRPYVSCTKTGIRVGAVAEPVAHRRVSLTLPSGEAVLAVEQYFVLHVEDKALSRSHWTSHEQKVMTDHYWWSAQELIATKETVWPENLVQLLTDAGVFRSPV